MEAGIAPRLGTAHQAIEDEDNDNRQQHHRTVWPGEINDWSMIRLMKSTDAPPSSSRACEEIYQQDGARGKGQSG
jgi:hypothetical protein